MLGNVVTQDNCINPLTSMNGNSKINLDLLISKSDAHFCESKMIVVFDNTINLNDFGTLNRII